MFIPSTQPRNKSLEQLVQEAGFADLKEFNRMVSLTDISTPDLQHAFRNWQDNDGSKEGLGRLATRAPIDYSTQT